MLQLNNASDSSSSSDSDSDSDQQFKPNNNHNQNNTNNNSKNVSSVLEISSTTANKNHNINNRKRKLSNIEIDSPNNPNAKLLKSTGPPKKRQKTNLNMLFNNTENEENKNNSKKKRKCDKNKNKNKNKKKQHNKTESIAPPKPFVDGIKIEELECIVCRELPPRKIYQCINSHLLCDTCYGRIREGKKCLCPQCRVRMSRREPSRNKLAENYLKAHLFECSNSEQGCKDKVQFCYLLQHSNHECKYRATQCKFHILGCTWRGLAKDRSKHNKICAIKKTDPKKILKLVIKLNGEKEEKQKKKDECVNKYMQICQLFETRARNIICRDIRITAWNENSKKTEILKSNCFDALYKRWRFQLKVEKVTNPKMNNNNSNNNNNNNNNNCSMVDAKLNKLYIRIRCLSSSRHRIPFVICVLKGPDFGYKLEPIQFECEINRHNMESKWIEMIPNNILFNDEDIKHKFFTNYNTENKMNLRIIMVDKRANGQISNEFGGGINGWNHDSIVDNNNNNNNNNVHLSDDLSDFSSSSDLSDFSSNSPNEDDDDEDDDIYSDLNDYSSSDSDDDYY